MVGKKLRDKGVKRSRKEVQGDKICGGGHVTLKELEPSPEEEQRR